MTKNRIVLFAATFLVVFFFFLAIPDEGYSQDPVSCCQMASSCENILDPGNCNGTVLPGLTCDTQFGRCIPSLEPPVSNVPTLSEWGLIATAGLLGLISFIMVRRRKTAA